MRVLKGVLTSVIILGLVILALLFLLYVLYRANIQIRIT